MRCCGQEQHSDDNCLTCAPGERLLFHGTSPDAVPEINKRSFNRGYCGKHATVYGNGMYFARDASYSGQTVYSPQDNAGMRFMYLARVFVGEYAVGSTGMVEPPKLPTTVPSGNRQTYDSTVNQTENPSIFVAYHDAQAYPQYLITFK